MHKLASSRAAGPDEPAEAREAAQLTEPPTPVADHKAEISALLSAPEGEALGVVKGTPGYCRFFAEQTGLEGYDCG